MRKLGIILIGLLAAFWVHAQEEITNIINQQKTILQRDPENVEALKKISFLFLNKADYDEAVRWGEKLLEIGSRRQDHTNAILYSHICLGQAYMMKGNAQTAFNHLGQARSIGEESKQDSALCSIYNGLGLYSANIDKDYYASIRHFFDGIEAAKRSNYQRLHTILVNNIAGIYFLKRDTVGLRYSLEAYERAHAQNEPFLIYSSSANTSFMYYLRKDYDKALQYIKEAEFVMLQNDFYDQTNIYALYGHVLLEQNQPKPAVEYFKKALEQKAKSQTTSIVFAFCGYAQALARLGNHAQAIALLNEALSMTQDKNSKIYRDDVLRELSSCYEALGQYNQALKWHQLLQIENDSLFNTDKERALSDMRVKYDSERQENMIKQHKLELLQKAKKEQLLLAVLVVIIVVALFLYYLYRRKNRFYVAIVRQNRDAIRREQQLVERIRLLGTGRLEEEVPKEESSAEKYAASSLTEEKKSNLFLRLETLMREEHVYTDNLLTKEKVAELLGTNRTYLSQVINEQTGQSFTQYMNGYRINEAVRLLSDPENQTPLKAISSDLGFNSMTTFYKLFQHTVGMTPTQYKDKVQELHRTDRESATSNILTE